MPDNEDYAALGRLLSSSAGWTEEDAGAARSALRHQEDALASVHPMDERRRAHMEGVAEALQAAIWTWERHNR